MSIRRRLITGLSTVAVGPLLAVALTAIPATAGEAPPGTISGTVTAPADETSRLINERWQAWQLVDTTYLASGEDFADALSGATAAAAEGLQLSLSRPDCVPAATVDSLKRNRIDTAKILGSELTLSRAVGTVTPC